MCMMCEGFSADDAVALTAARVAEWGFAVVGVHAGEREADGVEWAYTVGLLDGAGHPELVVAGPSVEAGGGLLSAIGHDILAGARFAAGDVVGDPPGAVRFGGVDPVQYALGTFAEWHALKVAGHLRAPHLEAVQVFAPDSWFCSGHRGRQPNLADPRVRIDVRGSGNRAARRAGTRRSRHRAGPR